MAADQEKDRRRMSPEDRAREDVAITEFVLGLAGEFIGPDRYLGPLTEGRSICIPPIIERVGENIVRETSIYATAEKVNVTINQPNWTLEATTLDYAVRPFRPSMELCRDGQPNLFGREALAKYRELTSTSSAS